MTTIKLNKTKSTKVDFEASIEGADESADIRMVIQQPKGKFNITVPCKTIGKNMWAGNIPPLGDIFTKLDELTFTVEVLVDGYIFTPADGKISWIDDTPITIPVVTFSTPSPIPQPANEATPNPKQAVSEVADIVVLPPTEDVATQPVIEITPTFNAKVVAEEMIKNTLGTRKKPNAPGSLFQRDEHGAVIVPGLESPEQVKLREIRSQKVRQVLQSMSGQSSASPVPAPP